MGCGELSEVLLAKRLRHAPVQQGLHHPGLQHVLLENERGILHIIQLLFEPIAGWQYESDPSCAL